MHIVSTRIGYSNSVLLVNGPQSILIDTGVKYHMKCFKNLFRRHKLAPSDVKLIVLTHTHYDHTGNLKALVKYTGAKVLVHTNEFENLKNGFTPIPKGLSFKTRCVERIGKAIFPQYASPDSFISDIVNSDEFDLNEFGIDGKIIHTPGHTDGSQSVLIGSNLISGDTFIHMRSGTIFPHFANDLKTLLNTWQNIFDSEIDIIYPGHGPRFKIEMAIPEFEKWKKKIRGVELCR